MISAPPGQERPLRVVKVGGSLLQWPLLETQLAGWLESQSDAANVLIAGGGALADAIRRADAADDLGEEQAHALCIEVLGVTGRGLVSLLAGRATLASWSEVASRQLAGPAWVVLDVPAFMSAAESLDPQGALPHTWNVTSDSIAAWVACGLAAEELVLLKSCEPPAGLTPTGDWPFSLLAAAGYVDRYFPTAVARFAGPVRMVNLRGFGAD